MNVGDRIKARRKELGMSAEALAKALNVSPATMYRYESGYIDKLPSTFLEPLSVALSTTPQWLLGWDPIPDVQPPKLTDEENHLLGLYNQLNRSGKDLVMQTAVTAVASGMYEEKEK